MLRITMAGKPPTCQQLAYLDELKERLRELRKRQVTFMEETAEILRTIGPDRVRVPKKEASSEQLSIESVEESEQSPVEDGESVGNIKQLIRRFEDLRQTSRQFNDQTMPQELAGVDVRRLLNGYENLIVEGNMLQKNWMQLKKTSESCAQLSLWGNDNDNDRPEGRTGQVKSLKISIESQRAESKSKSGKRDVALSSMDAEPRVSPKIKKSQSSKHISFCIEANKESLKTPCKSAKDKDGSLRYGAVLQMLLRVSPFKSCARPKAMPPHGT